MLCTLRVKSGLALLVALGFIFCSGSQARADIIGSPGVEWTVGTQLETASTFTMGYQFTAKNPVFVTALGSFNPKSGMTKSHPVGLWDSKGNLLAKTTVLPTDTLIGNFRYSEILPVQLTAGQNYTVGALTTGDNFAFNGQGFTINPDISAVQDRFDGGGGSLSFPTITSNLPEVSGNNGYFGGNVIITQQIIPEPGTILLVGLGLLGLVGYGWRRRKQSAAA